MFGFSGFRDMKHVRHNGVTEQKTWGIWLNHLVKSKLTIGSFFYDKVFNFCRKLNNLPPWTHKKYTKLRSLRGFHSVLSHLHNIFSINQNLSAKRSKLTVFPVQCMFLFLFHILFKSKFLFAFYFAVHRKKSKCQLIDSMEISMRFIYYSKQKVEWGRNFMWPIGFLFFTILMVFNYNQQVPRN